MSAEKLLQALSLATDKLAIKGILQGTVKEVVGYDHCTVEVMPGLELYDVRLNSVLGLDSNQVTLKPAEGSKVLVGIIENVKTQAVVLAYGELQEFFIKIGTASIRVRDSKIKIECDGENLNTVLQGFIYELKKTVVIYGRTPNVPALILLQQRLNKILE